METKIDVTKTEFMPEVPYDSNSLKITAKRLEELGKDLSRRYLKFKEMQERKQIERDWAEAFAADMLQAPDKDLPYEGFPNFRCVLPRIGVDGMHANSKYSFFGDGEAIKVRPDYVSHDFTVTGEKVADVLTYQSKYEAELFHIFDKVDRNSWLYGNAYMEPRYCKEYRWVTEKVTTEGEEPEVDAENGTVTMKKIKTTKTRKVKETVFDGIKVDEIPAAQIFRSPFIEDLETAVKTDVVFKWTRQFIKDVRRFTKKTEDMAPFYIPGQVDQLTGRLMDQLLSNESRLEQVKREYDGFDLSYVLDDEQIDLVTAYTWADVDGDDIPEEVQVVFNPESKIVIRVSLAPCRIVDFKPFPVQGRANGQSILQFGRPIYEEYEEIHNLRVAKGQWENTPFGFYETGGRFNPEEITIMPGKFYPLDRGSQVTFAQPSQVSASYFQEEQLLFNYFERLLGLSDNMQGVQSAKESTATERIQVSKGSAIKLSTPISRQAQSLGKLFGHMYDLDRECAPEDKEYFLTSSSNGAPIFDKIGRDAYHAQMTFKVDMSTVFDQQQARDTALLALKTLTSHPMIMNNPAVQYQLLDNTVKNLNVHLDIPKPPQSSALSPSEEHVLFQKGENPEPIVGEDYDEHIKRHMAFLRTEKFEDLEDDAKQKLIMHIDKTQVLKKVLESANLNKSGVFEGMPGQQPGQGIPPVTANRNPTQTFNTMRAGEAPNSQRANIQNSVRPQ